MKLALALLLLAPLAAQADPINFTFQGTVAGIYGWAPCTLPFVTVATCGDVISGSFSYGPNGPATLSATIGGQTWTTTATAHDAVDSVIDDWVLSGYVAALQTTFNVVVYGGSAYPFCGWNSGCYGRTDYPAALPTQGTFQVRDGYPDLEMLSDPPVGNHFLSAYVGIADPPNTSSVPEPSSLVLLASGLGVLAVRKWRKRV